MDIIKNKTSKMIYENNLQFIINVLVAIVGLITGLIIGYYLFKRYQYKGPDSNIVCKEIYTDNDGHKYKWIPKVCVCPISYSMNKLKDSNYIDPNH